MKKSLWADKLFRRYFSMVRSRYKSGTRHSKKREPNTPERLAFIREKYKDGVPAVEVGEWINSL